MTQKIRMFDKTKVVEIPTDHAGKSLDDDGVIYDVVEEALCSSPSMTHLELVGLAREVLGAQGSPEERRSAMLRLAGASLRVYWSHRPERSS